MEGQKVAKTDTTRLKSYYKVTVINAVWYCWKKKQIDQWHREETPERNLHIVHWSLLKQQRQCDGPKINISPNGTGTTGHPCAVNVDTNLGLSTKINSKWIIYLV